MPFPDDDEFAEVLIEHSKRRGVYREMETTPPAKPPRREWIVARGVRALLDDDEHEFRNAMILVAALGLFLTTAILVADWIAPAQRDDTPPPPTHAQRCAKGGGTWNAGEIDGKRAEWCSWGRR